MERNGAGLRPAMAICLLCVWGAMVYFAASAVLSWIWPAQVLYQVEYTVPGMPEKTTSLAVIDPFLMAELAARAEETPVLAPVLKAPEQYPESLIRLYLANPEVLDTLLAYPALGKAAQGVVSEDDLAGGFPRLMQWDIRWAYQPYGDDMLAVTGCGPACLSTVAIYLTGHMDFDPGYVARYAQKNGYYMQGTGTAWELMTQGAAGLGLSGEELPLDGALILSTLREGRPIICSVKEGDFTTGAGHFIVLVSADGDGNITVHDPARSANNARTWRYDDISHQIKNLWAFEGAQ